jgi:hypothetical protein
MHRSVPLRVECTGKVPVRNGTPIHDKKRILLKKCKSLQFFSWLAGCVCVRGGTEFIA